MPRALRPELERLAASEGAGQRQGVLDRVAGGIPPRDYDLGRNGARLPSSRHIGGRRKGAEGIAANI